MIFLSSLHFGIPLSGTADAEIKVPSVENLELTMFFFKAWMRSDYSHACLAHCQEFLPLFHFLLSRSIHLHFCFFKIPFLLLTELFFLTPFPVLGPRNKIGHPAHRHRHIFLRFKKTKQNKKPEHILHWTALWNFVDNHT